MTPRTVRVLVAAVALVEREPCPSAGAIDPRAASSELALALKLAPTNERYACV